MIGSGIQRGKTGINCSRVPGRLAMYKGNIAIPSPETASLTCTSGSLAITLKLMFGAASFEPRLSFQIPDPMQVCSVSSSGVAGVPVELYLTCRLP